MEDMNPRIETWVDDNGLVAIALVDAGILENDGKLAPAVAFDPLQALLVASALIEKAHEALESLLEGDEDDEEED